MGALGRKLHDRKDENSAASLRAPLVTCDTTQLSGDDHIMTSQADLDPISSNTTQTTGRQNMMQKKIQITLPIEGTETLKMGVGQYFAPHEVGVLGSNGM